MIEVRLLLLLDRIFQVADIIGRRYADVKGGSKWLVLMIDEETPNDSSGSHHGGDSSQTQVTQPPKFPKQVKVKATYISTSHMSASEIDTPKYLPASSLTNPKFGIYTNGIVPDILPILF